MSGADNGLDIDAALLGVLGHEFRNLGLEIHRQVKDGVGAVERAAVAFRKDFTTKTPSHEGEKKMGQQQNCILGWKV